MGEGQIRIGYVAICLHYFLVDGRLDLLFLVFEGCDFFFDLAVDLPVCVVVVLEPCLSFLVALGFPTTGGEDFFAAAPFPGPRVLFFEDAEERAVRTLVSSFWRDFVF